MQRAISASLALSICYPPTSNVSHCLQQNGMVERLIRTLKEQCVHRQRFEIQSHALRVIGDWIALYSQRRPLRALKR